jgi:hypothetical protein
MALRNYYLFEKGKETNKYNTKLFRKLEVKEIEQCMRFITTIVSVRSPKQTKGFLNISTTRKGFSMKTLLKSIGTDSYVKTSSI